MSCRIDRDGKGLCRSVAAGASVLKMRRYNYRRNNRCKTSILCREGWYVSVARAGKSYRWCVVGPGIGNRSIGVVSVKDDCIG